MASVRLEAPPSSEELGDRGWADSATNAQGIRLARYFWPAAGTPRGVVVPIHGHGAHTCFTFLRLHKHGGPNRYEGSWVEAWNLDGYAVAGQDYQGCGRSEGAMGLRAYVESFDDYVADVRDFVAWLAGPGGRGRGFGGLPIFLVGVSMGGCTALLTAHELGEAVRGVVLISPMLSLEEVAQKGWNPYLRPLLVLFSWLWPTLPIAETNRNERYPDIQAFYDADPACWHGKTRVRNAREYLRATEVLRRLGPDMKFPLLCLHGTGDTMCEWQGSRRFVERLGSEDKTFQPVEDGWHVLVHEPGNEDVLKAVTSWLGVRCD